MQRRQILNPLILQFTLLVAVIYCPYFLHLGNLPIHAWDEARLVANALEMNENGDYLVTHFNGQPEMWNTKPPLMIWAQVISMKLIGDQELAFRLPSAIAGFLTCLLIAFLSIRYLKNFWFGFITILILITSEGHLGFHVTRTGDYDAMLTLFMTAYSICFFLWTETGKTKFLHLFFTGVLLAVLTKSVQGLFFLPPLFIYALISGKLYKLFTSKWLYINSILFIIIVGAYYLGRESVNQGYLKAVYENELGGRMLNTIGNHKGKLTFYIELLYNKQFMFYCTLALLGFFSSYAISNKTTGRFIRFSTLLSFTYLVIISIAKTKLAWYTAPSIPLFSVLAAGPVFLVLELINNKISHSKQYNSLLISTLFLMLVFIYPYFTVIDKVYKPKETPEAWHFTLISHFLKDAVDKKYDLNNHLIFYNSYRVQLDYYVHRLNKDGVNVAFADLNNIKPGDRVLIGIGHDKDQLRDRFNTTEIYIQDHVRILRIDSKK
mgnify:CR=1 FL=1